MKSRRKHSHIKLVTIVLKKFRNCGLEKYTPKGPNHKFNGKNFTDRLIKSKFEGPANALKSQVYDCMDNTQSSLYVVFKSTRMIHILTLRKTIEYCFKKSGNNM